MLKQIEHIQKLNRNEIVPLYAVIGDEDYFKAQAVKVIVNRILDEAVKDFNYTIINGSDCEGHSLVNLASSFPMMSEFRVILVKESEKITAANVNIIKKYIEHPLNSTILIFEFSGSVRGGIKRGALYKALAPVAEIVEMKLLYENNVREWIKVYTAKHKKRIEETAVKLLSDLTGASAYDVTNEIDKLLIFINEREIITEDDVRSAVGISKSYNVFELCNAVGMRNMEKAMLIAIRMLDFGEKPTSMIVRLSKHFSNLRLLQLAGINSPQGELVSLLKINAFFVRDLKKQAEKYKDYEIKKTFHILVKFDEFVKTGYYDASTAVYLMLYHIINGTELPSQKKES